MIAAPAGVYAVCKQEDGSLSKRRVVAFSEVGGNSPYRPALVMSEEGELVTIRSLEGFSHMQWRAE